MAKCILIQGLPGSGKTTLAHILKEKMGAVHFNADWARGTITSYLSFTEKDRQIQARTLGQLGSLLVEQGKWCIVDFICPTRTTRSNFYNHFKFTTDVFSVWMNTINKGRFEDTNKIYERPGEGAYDYQVEGWQDPDGLEDHADHIISMAAKGHENYYIRYNTHSNGKRQQWRIISASTMEETLVDDFELRGHMTPASTVEHNVTKWNVQACGYGQFIKSEDAEYTKFILKY
jgi:adenylylsulfate kinase